MDKWINFAETRSQSNIYGPGKRYVIWVQGCRLHCKGCWNKSMWSFAPNRMIKVQDLVLEILSTPEIEGVSILGGEPFHQASALTTLAKELKKHSLGIMVYTGYELKELQRTKYNCLLRETDLLVAGRYQEKLRNTSLLWRGSENQNLHFLTERYLNYEVQEVNQVEIEIDENGNLHIAGFPNQELMEAIQ